jgi:anti-sigma B factor antagonist
MNLPAESEERNDVVVIAAPFEKLDMSTAAEFKRWFALIIAPNQRIVLDLETVNFVDSSGLGALLSALRDLTAAGSDLKLCQVQRRVRVMFELVRMDRVLSLHETREDAIAAFEQE